MKNTFYHSLMMAARLMRLLINRGYLRKFIAVITIVCFQMMTLWSSGYSTILEDQEKLRRLNNQEDTSVSGGVQQGTVQDKMIGTREMTQDTEDHNTYYYNDNGSPKMMKTFEKDGESYAAVTDLNTKEVSYLETDDRTGLFRTISTEEMNNRMGETPAPESGITGMFKNAVEAVNSFFNSDEQQINRQTEDQQTENQTQNEEATQETVNEQSDQPVTETTPQTETQDTSIQQMFQNAIEKVRAVFTTNEPQPQTEQPQQQSTSQRPTQKKTEKDQTDDQQDAQQRDDQETQDEQGLQDQEDTNAPEKIVVITQEEDSVAQESEPTQQQNTIEQKTLTQGQTEGTSDAEFFSVWMTNFDNASPLEREAMLRQAGVTQEEVEKGSKETIAKVAEFMRTEEKDKGLLSSGSFTTQSFNNALKPLQNIYNEGVTAITQTLTNITSFFNKKQDDGVSADDTVSMTDLEANAESATGEEWEATEENSTEQLADSVPAIAHLKTKEGKNMFVVVTAVDEENGTVTYKVGNEQMTVSTEEFSQQWSGKMLARANTAGNEEMSNTDENKTRGTFVQTMMQYLRTTGEQQEPEEEKPVTTDEEQQQPDAQSDQDDARGPPEVVADDQTSDNAQDLINDYTNEDGTIDYDGLASALEDIDDPELLASVLEQLTTITGSGEQATVDSSRAEQLLSKIDDKELIAQAITGIDNTRIQEAVLDAFVSGYRNEDGQLDVERLADDLIGIDNAEFTAAVAGSLAETTATRTGFFGIFAQYTVDTQEAEALLGAIEKKDKAHFVAAVNQLDSTDREESAVKQAALENYVNEFGSTEELARDLIGIGNADFTAAVLTSLVETKEFRIGAAQFYAGTWSRSTDAAEDLASELIAQGGTEQLAAIVSALDENDPAQKQLKAAVLETYINSFKGEDGEIDYERLAADVTKTGNAAFAADVLMALEKGENQNVVSFLKRH